MFNWLQVGALASAAFSKLFILQVLWALQLADCKLEPPIVLNTKLGDDKRGISGYWLITFEWKIETLKSLLSIARLLNFAVLSIWESQKSPKRVPKESSLQKALPLNDCLQSLQLFRLEVHIVFQAILERETLKRDTLKRETFKWNLPKRKTLNLETPRRGILSFSAVKDSNDGRQRVEGNW